MGLLTANPSPALDAHQQHFNKACGLRKKPRNDQRRQPARIWHARNDDFPFYKAIAAYMLAYVKTISLNVSDPTYRLFQAESERRDRPAAELIREAMEEYVRLRFADRLSLADIRPVSLGKSLVPIDWSEDIFDEMVT